ncbi:MAG: hydroxyisourate hydrolase [Cyclobacteriaceae bacterium]|nr:hydroxyisourate hydrolase [Cyclobacteriaceae bacterium]
MSQITTHVLDTALGKPAEGIKIILQRPKGDNEWEDIASGVTNSDGRIAQFMEKDQVIAPGIYRMFFETKAYFKKLGIKGFYPEVPVIFEITDTEHYHIPLLLSPFGYSTYRGS